MSRPDPLDEGELRAVSLWCEFQAASGAHRDVPLLTARRLLATIERDRAINDLLSTLPSPTPGND